MMLRQLTPLFAMMFIFSAGANTPSNEEIYQMMMELKKEIAELKAENKKLKESVEVVEESVDEVVIATDEAIKEQAKIASRTSFGGYGELHGNWLDDQHGSADKDEIDLHRFVIEFNHEFNDRLRFAAEVEYEHGVAGDGENGAVELEQAYIQYDLNDQYSITGGVFIMPIGILNETHEPGTFYGVERNNIETKIIPTAWWEGGAMLSAKYDSGISYDLAVSSGLKASAADYLPRDARQKVSEASAKSPSLTGRIKYTGIPGLEIAGSINYQVDYSQDTLSTVDDATLYEAHAILQRGNFGFKAMYAEWDIQGSGPESVGADKQFGWFVEPSYRINDVGFFTRYSLYDNKTNSSSDTEVKQWDIGVNWWIHKDVVVKLDYQDQSAASGITELDGINAGLGYAF
jgi:hypothetical protein